MGFGLLNIPYDLLGNQKGRRMLSARQNGVSLIELIIGIAVLSLLLAVGMPSFGLWIQNAQTRTAAESVLSGLQLARSEAVKRNAGVRFTLTSSTGLVAWEVGCVDARGDTCPALIQVQSADEGGGNARVGISTVTPTASTPTDYSVALAIGAGMAASEESEDGEAAIPGGAGVTFNGVGAVSAANIGTDITRIDVMNVASDEARRLVLIIGSGGLVKMCDPRFSLADNAQGCS
jgi:type IV fimbrial biogenesis protein FimT